jgi:hypothetical protein
MVEAQKLPKPLFTPSTKATDGHDQNIDRDAGVLLVGEERFNRLEQVAIELYETAAEYALERGIIIADTNFEFGEDETGRMVLGDEALTPDSSRFWPADEYATGGSPPSYDKQYVRDWLETLDWDKTPPGPELPADVVDGTRRRYRQAFERITGISLDGYLAGPNGEREGDRQSYGDPQKSPQRTAALAPCVGISIGIAVSQKALSEPVRLIQRTVEHEYGERDDRSNQEPDAGVFDNITRRVQRDAEHHGKRQQKRETEVGGPIVAHEHAAQKKDA